MDECPCRSGNAYAECCAPYIEGRLAAPTPEALMRSRYSAYSQGLVDYIADTMKGPAAKGFDKEDAKLWSQSVKWMGLRVLKAWSEGELGFVEFKATYSHANQRHYMHEVSEFHFEGGRWYYVDGKRRR